MNAAILPGFIGNDISDVRKVARGTAAPDNLLVFAKKIGKTTSYIDKNWENLPSAQKNNLKSFAYDVLDSPKGFEAIQITALAFIMGFFVKIAKKEKQIQRCGEKIDDLIDTILSKIEEDDSFYRQTLSDTLEEIKNFQDSGNSVMVKSSDSERELQNY